MDTYAVWVERDGEVIAGAAAVELPRVAEVIALFRGSWPGALVYAARSGTDEPGARWFWSFVQPGWVQGVEFPA